MEKHDKTFFFEVVGKVYEYTEEDANDRIYNALKGVCDFKITKMEERI